MMAFLPTIAAILQVYQITDTKKDEKGVTHLTSDITPESNRKALSPEDQELLMKIKKKIGKSKLFTPELSSKTYYNLGLLFFNQRDFAQAEKYLKAAIQADENDISAVNLLLMIYQSAAMNHLTDREYEAALLSLTKAEQLIEGLPSGINLTTVTMFGYVYKSLGQVYKNIDSTLSESYWEKAGKMFETVINANVKESGALNGLGNVYHHKQRYKEALQKYEEALEITPHYAAAANDAAMACEDLMRQDQAKREEYKIKAIQYWGKAIQLSKNDPQFTPEYGDKIVRRIQWLNAQ